MPHSRDALIAIAVEGYFGNIARGDVAGALSHMRLDTSMTVPSMNIIFADKQAIADHFDDFLKTYTSANFDDFEVTADTQSQSIAVRFHIILTPADGSAEQERHNCNFFEFDEAGKIERIVNYMSEGLSDGFDAGASH